MAEARSALLAQIRPLKRECLDLERRLNEMEAQRAALHEALAAPNAGQPGETEWARLRAEIEGDILRSCQGFALRQKTG